MSRPAHADLLDQDDHTIADFEQAFRGIEVAGVELASVSRIPLYISLQSREAFAAPSRRERAWYTLISHAIFLQERLKGTSPPLSPPAPKAPRVLFFFEGEYPSARESLAPVIAQFSPNEARAAATYPRGPGETPDHEWINLRSFLPTRTGKAFRGLEKDLGKAQRKSTKTLFRRPSFRAWLLRASIRTAYAASALRTLFDAFPATVLVTASDASFWGRCATLEATRRGIPSLTLQHGMMVGTSAYAPVVSSQFAAWGEASARWLRARAVPAEKLVVTGAPRLDHIVNRSPASREVIAAKLSIDPGTRWVVLATNPITFAHNAALLRAARGGIRAWGEKAILLVKLHPSEDPVPYRAMVARDAGVAIVHHGEVPLYDLLASAEVLLTFHSSVGVEAMLLDRPVISLEAFGDENPIPYAREGAAASARSADELAEILRREIAPGHEAGQRRERRSRFVRDNLFAADGKSAERVRDLIRTLAAGGSACA